MKKRSVEEITFIETGNKSDFLLIENVCIDDSQKIGSLYFDGAVGNYVSYEHGVIKSNIY